MIPRGILPPPNEPETDEEYRLRMIANRYSLATRNDYDVLLDDIVVMFENVMDYHVAELNKVACVEVRLRLSWRMAFRPREHRELAEHVMQIMEPIRLAHIWQSVVTTVLPPKWRWLWPWPKYRLVGAYVEPHQGKSE